VMKNFKKRKKKKTALIRISDIFTEWFSIFFWFVVFITAE
jgi:hypothetical protein